MSTSQSTQQISVEEEVPGLRRFAESTTLKRVWYFDGRFLDAADFRTEQDYVRSLVALSNRASGHGVVHGLDVELSAKGLLVSDGLAVNAHGDVIRLAEPAELDVAKLIDVAERPHEPAATAAKRAKATSRSPAQDVPVEPAPETFAPCAPPDGNDAGDDVRPRTGYWVLSIAPATTLCGEEERFANPCAPACETATDHSFVLEGAVFSVRRFSPGRHVRTGSEHRDRGTVASAWFAAERTSRRQPMSRALLGDRLWCDGASAASGATVDLAIFCRRGDTTRWVDEWTVRREICETNPASHWFHAMDMRPWNEFLAQVLQFQCLLADCLAHSNFDRYGPSADQIAKDIEQMAELGKKVPDDDSDTFKRVFASLSNAAMSRVVTDQTPRLARCVGGELPPCGWLPLLPRAGDLCASSSPWFASPKGHKYYLVDRDAISTAFRDAQHLDRISLHDDTPIDILLPESATGESDDRWFFFVRRPMRQPYRCGAGNGNTDYSKTGSADTRKQDYLLRTFADVFQSDPALLPLRKDQVEGVGNLLTSAPLVNLAQLKAVTGVGDGTVRRCETAVAEIAFGPSELDESIKRDFASSMANLANDDSERGARRRRQIVGGMLIRPYATRQEPTGASKPPTSKAIGKLDPEKLGAIDDRAEGDRDVAWVLDDIRRSMGASGETVSWTDFAERAGEPMAMFQLFAEWLRNKIGTELVTDDAGASEAPDLTTNAKIANAIARLPAVEELAKVVPRGPLLGAVGLLLLKDGSAAVFGDQ